MPWMPTAKPPIQSSPSAIDEIGEAHVGAAGALLHLLAEEGEAHFLIAGQREHIVALAAAAPQADDAGRLQPMLGDDPVEHLLRVGEQALALSPTTGSVEDRGIIAGQFPRAEEGRPVDMGLQIAQRPFAELVEAGLAAAAAPCRRDRTGSALARASSMLARSCVGAARAGDRGCAS